MFTQTHEMKLGQLVPVKDGATVKLLAQTQDHKVVFVGPGDKDVSSLPSSEFFASHREATPAEISDFLAAEEKKAKKPEPKAA
jgi:hypothetical protein